MSKLFKSTLPEDSFFLLQELMKNKSLNDFYLVGGTALALQIGHRVSVDLDLYFLDRQIISLEDLLKIFENFYPKESFNSYQSFKVLIDKSEIDKNPDPKMLEPINWNACFELVQNKIKEMQKVYKSDICESLREAQQTQEIIHHLTKQLEMLKNVASESGQIHAFTLKNGKERRTIKIGTSPNPANGIISANSPIGKQLLQSKPGNSIKIGNNNWVII